MAFPAIYIFHIPHMAFPTVSIFHITRATFPIFHTKNSTKTGYSNEYPGHSPVAMRSLPTPVYGRCGTVQSAPVPLQYRKRQLSLSAT